MREEIPSASTVAVVVEPGAEDEVGSCCKEGSTYVLALGSVTKGWGLHIHQNEPCEKAPASFLVSSISIVTIRSVFTCVFCPPIQA
jgi:hypothetical protein